MFDNSPLEGPRPLHRDLPPAPEFPTHALPKRIFDAVEAIQWKTQAPLAMCATSVLASCSLCAQGHADVALPTGSTKPLTLHCVSIAESGERKSSVDELANKAARMREDELRLGYPGRMTEYHAELDAWKVRRDELKRDHQKDRHKLASALMI